MKMLKNKKLLCKIMNKNKFQIYQIQMKIRVLQIIFTNLMDLKKMKTNLKDKTKEQYHSNLSRRVEQLKQINYKEKN